MYGVSDGVFNNLCREALKFAEVGAIAAETYNAAMDVLLEGARKISVVKKSVTKIKSPSSQGSGSFQDNGSKKTSVSIPDTVPSLWPWQDTAQNHFNINDAGPPVADLNHPTMAPIAINRDGSLADNSVVLTCFKSMTWVIENKNPASKVAVINLKLHDYGKTLSGETEVQFRLTRVTLEPMLKSMAYISQQLSTPANRVAVINLKIIMMKGPYGLLNFPNTEGKNCFYKFSQPFSWGWKECSAKQGCCLPMELTKAVEVFLQIVLLCALAAIGMPKGFLSSIWFCFFKLLAYSNMFTMGFESVHIKVWLDEVVELSGSNVSMGKSSLNFSFGII
ncbi:protein FAR1-RELATED SEQUENCE 3 [Sesamum angolense]|uniref:Protein FAR1-RELATED SEQUENCE 3 n=1 Tax=Sesamum angolense TaxID=2727404 RepID=A0AAE1XG97_9LAMI|nr:protein FAR1-RELATED SEQUENCE 3 [Sesamum angolense]